MRIPSLNALSMEHITNPPKRHPPTGATAQCYNRDMNTPIQLDTVIQSPAQIIQFAKDGKYEEAWIINLSDQKPNRSTIVAYTQASDFEELIVEYIWNPSDDARRYVLTVVQNTSCKVQDKTVFAATCLDLFYHQPSFAQLLAEIDHTIIGHPFLLRSSVQRVRLGVFNHWFSVGPIELWSAGEQLDDQAITQKIMNRPEVYESKLNYQGLAFIYNFDESLPGPYHVLKTPTCRKENDKWIVDIALVLKNLHRILKI